MTTRIYVPRDAAARAVGADKVAAAIAETAKQQGLAIELVRTGSRGLFWLETLVEVEIDGRRIGFGPVAPAGPGAPVAPAGPVAPVGPAGPTGPTGPIAPVTPVAPMAPVAG